MPRMFSESETIVQVKMKILVVFLLTVLGCTLAEGLVMSKCEVKNYLKNTIDNTEYQGLRGESLLARRKYWF